MENTGEYGMKNQLSCRILKIRHGKGFPQIPQRMASGRLFLKDTDWGRKDGKADDLGDMIICSRKMICSAENIVGIANSRY